MYLAGLLVTNDFKIIFFAVSDTVESSKSTKTNLKESTVEGWIIQLCISKLAGIESFNVLSLVFEINFSLIKLTPPLCQLIGNIPPLLKVLEESIELNFSSFFRIINALELIENMLESAVATILIFA